MMVSVSTVRVSKSSFVVVALAVSFFALGLQLNYKASQSLLTIAQHLEDSLINCQSQEHAV